MSTFDGKIREFPGVQIDYFCKDPYEPQSHGLGAYFLSHVHSDHLQGLDAQGFNAFVYCSAATKEVLVRLQRRAHRLNVASGIIETSECRYSSKERKLKTIPLDTPTIVEVPYPAGVVNKYRVTLFDANHCVGAVMFLIESTTEDKAVLYTGDIRAEEWWVDALARHPVLIPYTTGQKRLYKIYLDTTFANRDRNYQSFISKREGTRELLEQLFKYPRDTIFHLNTWTFGYEDVVLAMTSALREKAHFDTYQFGLYFPLGPAQNPGFWSQGAAMLGHKLGNNSEINGGAITKNKEARIHCCDWKLACPGVKGKKNVVWITPVITRINGTEFLPEKGTGGGGGDLDTHDDLVINSNQLEDLFDWLGADLTPELQEFVANASKNRTQTLPLLFPSAGGVGQKIDKKALNNMIREAASRANMYASEQGFYFDKADGPKIVGVSGELLPTRIRFPYSRHSSYSELRYFVGAFRPRGLWANVVNHEGWREDLSMESLFGDLCSGDGFEQDRGLRQMLRIKKEEEMRDAMNEEDWAVESQRRAWETQMPLSSDELIPSDDGDMEAVERLERVVEERKLTRREMMVPTRMLCREDYLGWRSRIDEEQEHAPSEPILKQERIESLPLTTVPASLLTTQDEEDPVHVSTSAGNTLLRAQPPYAPSTASTQDEEDPDPNRDPICAPSPSFDSSPIEITHHTTKASRALHISLLSSPPTTPTAQLLREAASTPPLSTIPATAASPPKRPSSTPSSDGCRKRVKHSRCASPERGGYVLVDRDGVEGMEEEEEEEEGLGNSQMTDISVVGEAERAVLGVNGGSWWDVGLRATRRGVGWHEVEVEL